MIEQGDLVEKVRAYDANFDESLLNRAYVFSMAAHGTQRRASGDLYFSHPAEVAGIVSDMRLDSATVATALLHDTVEDTLATIDQIDQQFGSEVAQLVDGVTKLSQLKLRSANDRAHEAENFRKLLLAMSNDLRVLLVKLADRLHNMRTLQYIGSTKKRHRIATETMDIYAPLAERIGMQQMKEELEDLAFAELNSEARSSIMNRLHFLRREGEDIVTRITKELNETLIGDNLKARVFGREKRPYSIWQKMKRQNITFEKLSDVMAFRIIVDLNDQCYQALGSIHASYSMVPESFHDYVSTPKPNGYRSLHTSVIGPVGRRIEIQIKTEEMNDIAEYGVAAHWRYKQNLVTKGAAIEGGQYRWIRELLEILEHGGNPEEFLENTKLEMFQDQVFCFTPKGELIGLPRGATSVDLAYAVHTKIGDTCVGAKVNGRIVPLRNVLENGDQVEIVRSAAQTPSPLWLNFVVTGKARSAIRRFIRDQQLAQYLDLGRAILERVFDNGGHQLTSKMLERACKVLQLRSEEELYASVGQGVFSGRQVLEAVYPGEGRGRGFVGMLSPAFVRNAIRRVRSGQTKGGDHLIPIRGLIPGVAVHLATCCHPLPGDRIVGIQTEGHGVTVHTIDCTSLENFSSIPERWLDLSWERPAEGSLRQVGRIKLTLTHEPGALYSVTGVVARNVGNISNLVISNRAPDFFEFLVDIEVEDVKHLTDIIAALRNEPMVHSASRLRK